MAHLTLVVQGREVRKFVLNPSVTTIGRAQDNDIVINNLALSRRHAEVHLRRGRFEVEDKGSQNGVFVNADRIDGPKALKNADTITLGTYQFVFSDEVERDPDIKAARKPRQEVTQLEEEPEAPETEPEPEAIPLLVLKYNDMELQRFPLKLTGGMQCVVGRGKDCTIQIAERRLSRRHCAIEWGDNCYMVRDLGSQNGTYVNRRRIPETFDLTDGDVLNFAEYSVLYLADSAAYDGPDRAREPAEPRPMSDIEREETAFPEAYDEERGETPPRPSVMSDHRLSPSEMSDPDMQSPAPPVSLIPPKGRPQGRPQLKPDRASRDAQPRDPLVEKPDRAMERQKKKPGLPARSDPPSSHAAHPVYAQGQRSKPAVRVVEPEGRRKDPLPPTGPIDYPKKGNDNKQTRARVDAQPPAGGDRPAVKARRVAPAVEVHNKARGHEEEHDVYDDAVEQRPDEALDDWYQSREEGDEEPSVLLERSKSSMSQILSTMMVDKRELDKNLAVRARARRFVVQVTWGSETIYAGPLKGEVTILGTDRDSDIKLKGRYVAGRHSLLVRVRDSLLLVRLGSSSAARVNGLPKLQAFLKTGDVIQIDETTIKIMEE